MESFSFELQKPNVVGLIGPNGAGKTTLFNILSGFLPTNSGSFRVNEKNILNLPAHQIVHSGLSQTFQDLRLLRQITVQENLLLCALDQLGEKPWSAWLRGRKYKQDQKKNLKKVKSILEFIGLLDKQNDLAEALSYGQQKLFPWAVV